MKNGILTALILLCACSLTGREVSRVAIPETVFSTVVVQDEKGLYRYKVFENGAPATSERIFGGSASNAPLRPVLTEISGVVRIAWSQEAREVAFLEFDRASSQITQDSNLSDRPPLIERREESARFEAQQSVAGDARDARA